MDNQKQQRLQERLLPEMEEFKAACQTLMLATLGADGQPNVSYAPFAQGEQGFFIMVSDIARHGMNLKVNKQLSVMMVQDEASAKSIYGRKRLTFDVTAELIERDTPVFRQGAAALAQRFGEIADNLAQLADFNLYCLKPSKGLFVKGFGQAFAIGGKDLNSVSWMTGDGKGHGHARSA
ncbi:MULTISPECIES: heme utilization protein HutZ [Ferrimonas]|uniref:heme utilization protein HutZ n=1 Tax=Ferrimonas TaxID=44011 RepID=UPI0004169062|nr:MULTISPECIES: heme utilization protein HutZ [Ferrimonas]USD38881.1 heme utilization protein HutZ [Ferrimonas sp. SCSIO 43195]